MLPRFQCHRIRPSGIVDDKPGWPEDTTYINFRKIQWIDLYFLLKEKVKDKSPHQNQKRCEVLAEKVHHTPLRSIIKKENEWWKDLRKNKDRHCTQFFKLYEKLKCQSHSYFTELDSEVISLLDMVVNIWSSSASKDLVQLSGPIPSISWYANTPLNKHSY